MPFGNGHSDVQGGDAREIIADADELFGVRIGQGVQQRGIHDAEDGGGGSDAQGHGENDDGAETGGLPQHAKSVAEILPEVIACASGAGFAKAFLRVGDIAEGATSGGLRVTIRETFRAQTLGFQLDVGLDFGVEIASVALALEHGFIPPQPPSPESVRWRLPADSIWWFL